jgi:hydrogenase expression/formation protein HypE
MPDLTCPVLTPADDRILLGHGGGGRLMQQLLERVFLPAFASPELDARHDGALLHVGTERLAFTTDGYVVRPLIFPGGSIGDLAVNGTVNDLAMCGAKPLWLSAGFILEEGLDIQTLDQIVASMRDAARAAGVTLVTGDTKVVDRGKGDGVFITTAGIGRVEAPATVGPDAVRPGDSIIVSGDIGRHGVAILSVREGLQFDAPIVSDCGPLWEPVAALLAAGIEVHCLRDLTRGGLASALCEIAAKRQVGIRIDDALVPVDEAVRGACEMLGLDPLYVACEGRFVAFVPAAQEQAALTVLSNVPISSGAVPVGTVLPENPGIVLSRSRIGGHRVVDLFSGEQLPRIC